MQKSSKSPLASHRRRMKRDGFVRVEVRVKKQDAALVRRVASALGDPVRGDEARAVLSERFAQLPAEDLKALLEAAPLEGIDLDRPRDMGRKIDI